MKKNHNPLIVVLDVEQYYRLLNSAEIGDREAGGNAAEEAARHAKRFNAQLAADHQAMIKHERVVYARARSRVRDLLRRTGGEVWHKRGDNYAQAKILGPAKDGNKLRVRVETLVDKADIRGFLFIHEPEPRERIMMAVDVWASEIADAPPDGSVYQATGYFAGTYLAPPKPA